MVRTGAATENGEETVLGTVMMLAGENSRIVAHRVGTRMQELQERLPNGIEVRVVITARNSSTARSAPCGKKNPIKAPSWAVVVLSCSSATGAPPSSSRHTALVPLRPQIA